MVAVENLPPSCAEPQPNAFYIEWGTATVIDGHAGNAALMSLECTISYYTLGTVQSMVDRGRVLGQLDDELLGICQPTNTEKYGLYAVAKAQIWARASSESTGVSGGDNERSGGQTQLLIRDVLFAGAMYEQAYQEWTCRAIRQSLQFSSSQR